MGKRFERTCVVCGKKYEYCSGCATYDSVPTWYNVYHNENCREIFRVATQYHNGKLDREEAKAAFKACDLSYINDLKPSIHELIDELLKEPIIEEQLEDCVLPEIGGLETEEVAVIAKPKRSRKLVESVNSIE